MPENNPPPDQVSDATAVEVTRISETTNGPHDGAATFASAESTNVSSRRSPQQRLLIAAAVVGLIALLAYFLWPRPAKTTLAVEKPPALEGKHAAENGEGHGEEHSQEGAIEVSDETDKLVRIKTEAAVKGDIEETISTVGKVLVAPNSQAIIGAKVEGRAVRVLGEP